MKVLFLDREEPVRRKLQNMIPWIQYEFTQFLESDSFDDAFALIQLEKPELIVTDLRLKDISGEVLIREIRKIDYNAKLIILTEETRFTDAQSAINCGVTAYLTKPADPEELSWAVMRAVDEIQKTKLVSIYYEIGRAHV